MIDELQHIFDHRRKELALLFGHRDEECILGAYLTQPHLSEIDVYKRTSQGVAREKAPFYPFFHLADAQLIERFSRKHWVKELRGSGAFRYLCAFHSWNDMWDAIQFVGANYQRTRGTRLDFSSHEEILLKNDPATQYLLQSGNTAFKGMLFSDLIRMQIALAIVTTHGFSNADRETDQIVGYAASDSTGWSESYIAKKNGEAELLRRLIETIRERDPDILEGEHLLSFDLHYIVRRAERFDIPVEIGRDGREPMFTMGKFDIENEITAALVTGRHVVDAASVISHGEIERHGAGTGSLREAAILLGYPDDGARSITPHRIGTVWLNEPEELRAHLERQASYIRHVMSRRSGSAFYLSMCVPMNYAQQFTSGSAAKIESILLREYIREHAAVPRPSPGMMTSGGHVALLQSGLFQPVLHVDVDSMYPSIMLAHGITPASDHLGIFQPVLRGLTSARLDAKRAWRSETDEELRLVLDEIQYAMKILINSFYGYLSYARALFNDFPAADATVRHGQTIIRRLLDEIRTAGGSPIEVDTDGIYFVPPQFVDSAEKEAAFVERIAIVLPEDIRSLARKRYKKMLSYKAKNYALLDESDHIVIKGSSLTSRGMERFARNFIAACIECLLREDIRSFHMLYRNLVLDVRQRRLNVWDFAKLETLRTGVDDYKKEIEQQAGAKRNHSALHEALIRSMRPYKIGERIAYYFAGSDPNAKPHTISKLADEWNPNARDENTAFYLKRIDELMARFKVFFPPQDFREITSIGEELFEGDFRRMKIITTSSRDENPLEDE